ncbi:hypothetical protein L209DRAFT_414800 [Thermothelomyces heterothallicus CBS 203.75]
MPQTHRPTPVNWIAQRRVSYGATRVLDGSSYLSMKSRYIHRRIKEVYSLGSRTDLLWSKDFYSYFLLVSLFWLVLHREHARSVARGFQHLNYLSSLFVIVPVRDLPIDCYESRSPEIDKVHGISLVISKMGPRGQVQD